MNDLISREALLEAIKERIIEKDDIRDEFDRHYNIGLLKAIKDVKLAPSVEAEPVRHGKWIADKIPAHFVIIRCSACGAMYQRRYKAYFSFCPNCSTKMDLEEMT